MVKKDRRKKEWQDLTDEEKRYLKMLDNREISEEEIKALLKGLKDQKPPTQSFYNHSEGNNPDGGVLRLQHPGGGTAYALSYHPQKWAESLSGGEKPHMVAIGHYHKAEYLFYRNIHMFQAGTFQNQTPFMRRKRLSAHLGGWVVWLNKQEPLGILSDTHIASKYWSPDLLEDYMDKAISEGVTRFYHAGDMTDGENVYRGQVYNLYSHGCKAQALSVIEEYPKRDGVVTYYILGNHDLSFWKTAGADISDLIDIGRPDLRCLGQEEADIKVTDEPIERITQMFVPYY